MCEHDQLGDDVVVSCRDKPWESRKRGSSRGVACGTWGLCRRMLIGKYAAMTHAPGLLVCGSRETSALSGLVPSQLQLSAALVGRVRTLSTPLWLIA